jgi:toxin secretion/phage lysis holin
MDKTIDYLKIIFSLIGGVLGCFFGDINSLFYALVAFVVLDYITGILLAIHDKKISSEIGFKGISKKIIIFILVGVGNVIDQYIIGAGSSLRTLLIMFYLSNEGFSILENASSIGLPVPQKLKNVLQNLNDSDKTN